MNYTAAVLVADYWQHILKYLMCILYHYYFRTFVFVTYKQSLACIPSFTFYRFLKGATCLMDAQSELNNTAVVKIKIFKGTMIHVPINYMKISSDI